MHICSKFEEILSRHPLDVHKNGMPSSHIDLGLWTLTTILSVHPSLQVDIWSEFKVIPSRDSLIWFFMLIFMPIVSIAVFKYFYHLLKCPLVWICCWCEVLVLAQYPVDKICSFLSYHKQISSLFLNDQILFSFCGKEFPDPKCNLWFTVFITVIFSSNNLSQTRTQEKRNTEQRKYKKTSINRATPQ